MRIVGTLLLIGALLAGCGGGEMNFRPTNLPRATARLSAMLGKADAVVLVNPSDIAELVVRGERFDDKLKNDLENALFLGALLEANNPRKLDVTMTLTKLDFPLDQYSWNGLSVGAHAHYEVIDRRDGALLFTTDVDNTGFAGAGVAATSMTRLRGTRAATADALRGNLQQFILRLQVFAAEKGLPPL